LEARRALFVAFFLSCAILVLELAGGVVFHSAALTADALHVVTDILAVAFSLTALTISARPPTGTLTYGYHRFEVVASLANGISLMGIAVVIMYEAYLRFVAPQPIGLLGTVVFAAAALGLNLLASRVLQSAQVETPTGEDLNVSSARLHMFGDALASIAVILGAVAVFLTGKAYLDPLVAAFIGVLVIRSAMTITWQGGAIILERSPFKDMDEMQRQLGSVVGVSDVHDLHIWRICSHITVASVHACLDPASRFDPSAVRARLETKMSGLGMQHVTIQLEDVCCTPRHEHVA
jgi:cobalt-zinc-cadmium efflux system protein